MALSMATKQQIIQQQMKRYQRASKAGKGKILTALETSTGLDRKHLSRVLSSKYTYKESPVADGRGRKPVYGISHKRLLVHVWQLLGYPSSRRLASAMPDVLDNLCRSGALTLDPLFRQQMLEMSHTTMDRLLYVDRQRLHPFGLGTTKPGTLLKHQIPIRRGTDWDNNQPGFLEIDLVAHCGSTTRGEFLLTLDCTDIASGWTECRAVRNKARSHTLNAVKDVREHLPFPLLGLDSDNGSEFINYHFLQFCQDHHLLFTRGRPNNSNDSCHVEQKNWSIVRRFMGYDRYEGQSAVDLFNRFYEKLSLLNNFFLPSQKLLERHREGSKVRKKHDKAATPYRRLLADPNVDDMDKQSLTETFRSLDLVRIRNEMDEILAQIRSLSLGY